MSSKGYKYIAFNVIDELGKTIANLTSINIYKTGTTTAATLYADAEGCSTISNPITSILDNGVKFWVKQPVDIVVTTDSGLIITKTAVISDIDDIVVWSNHSNLVKSPYALGTKLATCDNMVTVSYTIGLKGITGCDLNFTSDGEAAVEEGIEVEDVIPAYCKLVDVALVCKTSVDGSGDKTFTFDIGTASGGNQIVSAVAVDAANEVGGSATKSLGVMTLSSVAQSIFVSGTPTANWSTLTAGKWVLLVTYIDYSDLF